ncbi:hypothetical protein TNCV_2908871 [Trichonephila clavipes]|nr:hypothetical protein TNCV_2908871 [Trichonephila clavipes]
MGGSRLSFPEGEGNAAKRCTYQQISSSMAGGPAGFTASAHAENEGVNELLRHCCPFGLAAPIEAPGIVTGGKVRAAKRLGQKIPGTHARWD